MATFKGVITYASPVVGGISKSGKEWKRATYILVYDDSNGQYPKSISFDAVNDRIEKLDLGIGMEYEVSVDFTTREYNGRIYMSATAWKATPTQQPQQVPVQQSATTGYAHPQAQAQTPKDEMVEDLPF